MKVAFFLGSLKRGGAESLVYDICRKRDQAPFDLCCLYRKEDEGGAQAPARGIRKYEKMVYEYSRSASSAISEFAPNNSFYVDGRKLTIDQVDLTTAQAAKWRLCPSCSHAQIEEAGKHTAACPRCGSRMDKEENE